MGFVVLRKWTAVSQTSWINPPNRYSAYFSSVPVVAVVVGDDMGLHDGAINVWGVEKIHGSLTNEMKKNPIFQKNGFWC